VDAAYEALLKRMLSDMEQADRLFQPTNFWRQCSRRLIADLEQNGIERFRAQPAPLSYFVPTYVFGALAADPERYGRLAQELKSVLEDDAKGRMAIDEFLEGRPQASADYRTWIASYRDRRPFTRDVSESRVGEPVGQFEFDGRRYSRSMMNYLLGLEFAKRHLEDIPVTTVLEIGGGFGTLGEILLSDRRNETFYIDVDIPPTALFSTYYLRQLFGDDRVVDFEGGRENAQIHIDDLRREASAAVLCSWQLPQLRGKVDLFVNFISFQEMEPEVVENYLGHVRRLEARHVLLRNLREGKQIARVTGDLGVETATLAADYDRFLTGYDLVAVNVLPFGYRTVDGYHSELRLYRRSRGS